MMSYKSDCPCWEKAADDEPVFVLRAQDELAPAVIEFWASMALKNGIGREKYDAAFDCAEAMRAWPHRKMPD